MNDALVWLFWFLILISIFGYLFFGLIQFKKIHKTNYLFHHHLPYELNEKETLHGQLFSSQKVLFFFFIVSLFAYWETMFVFPGLPISYLLLLLMVIFLFSSVSVLIIHPKQIEIYLMMVTLYLVSYMAVLFLASYITFTSPYTQFHSFLPWITLIQGIVVILLIMNPSLKRWAILEKVNSSSNEKPLYRRPTFFVMAYTQWLLLANVILWVIFTQIAWVIA